MTQSEREYLKQHYGRLSEKYLTRRLGVSPAELRHEAFLLGLSAIRKVSRKRKRSTPEAGRHNALDSAAKKTVRKEEPAIRKPLPEDPHIHRTARKPKPDTRMNPLIVSPGTCGDRIPVRIDTRTIILIPPGVDPEKRKAEFLKKMNSSQ
jgi:hypothetical protein